jgi:hypothetical protein
MDGPQTRPGERNALRIAREGYLWSHRSETYSAILSRPPVLLDPWQDGVASKNSAPVEDALRSVRRKFDTRPVSMNLHHPTAIDGPEKSEASGARAIATAAEQCPSIPA